MPRMLRRAAVLGATAHVASQRGAAKAQAAQQQVAPPTEMPEQAVPEQTIPEQPSPPVAEAVAARTDAYGDLMKLKELLDAGALTQAEFDAEKQKILAS